MLNMDYSKNCLSYWFPRLLDAGIPVPRTEIVQMSGEAARDVYGVFDGRPMTSITSASHAFFDELLAACKRIGYPVFLRTGQGSGKHKWRDTCYLAGPNELRRHVVNLIEWSEIVDMIGLAWNVWCAREMLLTTPVGVCPRYGDMPVCREFRFFVSDGTVRCQHPYWPSEALTKGGFVHTAEWYSEFCALPKLDGIYDLASRAGQAIGGEWSVDILDTKRGWVVTDCAIAERSWHRPGCPNADRKEVA